MSLEKIRSFLNSRYRRVDPLTLLRAINAFEYEDVLQKLADYIITDMYLTRTLVYVSIEKEDPTLKQANLISVFSFTHGLDIWSIPIMRDLLILRYGNESIRSSKGMVTCAPYAPGIWRTGVLFCLVDKPKPNDIEDAIGFSGELARKVSSITIDDLLELAEKKPKAKKDVENFLARIFELQVESFLRKQYGYINTDTSFKPPYLKGREIDVIARKDILTKRSTLTVCECKLRFDDRPITEKEIEEFAEKLEIIKEYEILKAEKEGKNLKLYGWLITNTSKLSESAIKLAEKRKIEIKVVRLPKNWRQRSDWNILGLLNE